jgi:class 3 adenylate cyclase/tetratricopeptide (TPR) repeat protein
MRCVHCNAENPSDWRFCGGCGAGREAACPGCGTAREAGRRFCTGCGLDLAPPVKGAATDEGERRHATVMFSDVSGYTALNEALDPEEVEAVMSRIKADATAIVERHGGTVNQFVGDEVMALFGVPRAHRDDARSAVRAALELHQAVEVFAATLLPATARTLALHSGINTGLVVTRRSDARAGDYALTGDAVNLAARLRNLAEPGEVVVSAATWQQVSDHFEAEATAPILVKGKEQPLVAYRVRRERPAPSIGGSEALVGRDEELREFRAIAEACAVRKRSRVVVVRGDPGVGKTRMVAAFVEAARERGFSCHGSAVLDFGVATGRDALRTLARSLLGVPAASDEPTRRQAIETAAAAQALPEDRRLFLYDLLDVAPSGELRALAAAMSTSARDKGSLQALCELAERASAAAPLLLVVEDIHWADPWTLERLAALAVLAARQPFLLVMTTRFAGDPTAGAWRTTLHGAPLIGIDLGALSTEDSLRLAAQASAVTGDSCRELCQARGGQSVVPAPAAARRRRGGAGAPAWLDPGACPHPHGPPRGRRQACAPGRRRPGPALHGRRPAPPVGEPGYDCQVLVEQFLVRPDGGELMFCHALIRDGAYASLLHKRRRILHARAAEWFGALDPVLAAEHFDRADDPRAAGAYLAAAEALAVQFRYQAALALVERGLALAAERTARFSLLMARGRLLLELGRSADAIEASGAALDAADGPGERVQALIAMAAGMRLNERIDDGLAALAEAEPMAVGAALGHELSRLHHLRGNLLFPLGRHEECLREHELARDRAREVGSLEAEAAALGGLGDGYYLQGRMRSAHQQFRECVALARAQGYGRLEVANLSMVGFTGLHLARIGEAVAVGQDAIELAMRASQPRAEMMARLLVRWVEGLVRGRLDAADREAAPGLELARSLGAKRFEAHMLGLGALVELRRGDRTLARELAQSALATARQHGMGHGGPWLYGICALLEVDRTLRLSLLEEGERQLTRGCVSHNFIQLRELAIDALLEIGDWDGVVVNCERIRAYTAAEPLAMCEFVVARGLALARFGRGERSTALQESLLGLQTEGAEAELNTFLPALEAALRRF